MHTWRYFTWFYLLSSCFNMVNLWITTARIYDMSIMHIRLILFRIQTLEFYGKCFIWLLLGLSVQVLLIIFTCLIFQIKMPEFLLSWVSDWFYFIQTFRQSHVKCFLLAVRVIGYEHWRFVAAVLEHFFMHLLDACDTSLISEINIDIKLIFCEKS